MGYGSGYGVLNHWHPDWNEDWHRNGPYTTVRSQRDGWGGPWQREVEIVLKFLDGKMLHVWCPVEQLERTIWWSRTRHVFSLDDEVYSDVRQRFTWFDSNVFAQELMP